MKAEVDDGVMEAKGVCTKEFKKTKDKRLCRLQATQEHFKWNFQLLFLSSSLHSMATRLQVRPPLRSANLFLISLHVINTPSFILFFFLFFTFVFFSFVFLSFFSFLFFQKCSIFPVLFLIKLILY